MKASIERRLAKLEASAGIGKGEFILEVIRADETVEEFDRRVDALVRESTERTGCSPSVLKIIIAPPRPKPGDGDRKPNGSASESVVDGARQLEAPFRPGERQRWVNYSV